MPKYACWPKEMEPEISSRYADSATKAIMPMLLKRPIWKSLMMAMSQALARCDVEIAHGAAIEAAGAGHQHQEEQPVGDELANLWTEQRLAERLDQPQKQSADDGARDWDQSAQHR